MQNNPDAMRQAMQLAQSEAGQQLLQFLRQSGGEDLDQAMNRARAGDYTAIKSLLSGLMENPQARELMKKMGGNHGPAGR